MNANNTNINSNTNLNTVNVKVKVDTVKKRSYNRKPKNTWLKKAIVGGVISLLVFLVSYYLTKSSDGGAKTSNQAQISPGEIPMEGTKQN